MSFSLTIVGVGGVGGVLAGPLLRKYGGQIHLVARGRRGEHLRRCGLTLHSDVYGEFTAECPSVVETPEALPVQDYILVCVKNGALPEVTEQIRTIADEHTVVVPVMNGVTAPEVMRRGAGKVAGSVIYTVSGAGEDHSITQKGKFTYLVLEDLGEKTTLLHSILTDAGIDCRLTGDIKTASWNKYVFNCAYNTMTAACSTDAGHLKEEPLRSDFAAILAEAKAVGCAAGAALKEDMVAKELHRLDKTTDSSTSSLSRDFDAKRAGEMEVFSGDLVRMAKDYGIGTPVMERYYEKLLAMAAEF